MNILKRNIVYKKLFIDSDILLDLFLVRKPYNQFTAILLEQSKGDLYDIYTSTLILTNIHYLVSKEFNRHVAKEQLKILLGIIQMLPFEPDDVQMALNSEHVDFEDTAQFFIAQKHKCDLVISRNIKHYKKFNLPVLTAEQFLEILS